LAKSAAQLQEMMLARRFLLPCLLCYRQAQFQERARSRSRQGTEGQETESEGEEMQLEFFTMDLGSSSDCQVEPAHLFTTTMQAVWVPIVLIIGLAE
jgi:hypothetical protein